MNECIICKEKGPIRNVNLYVIGSEGLDVCHNCEMELVHFARSLMDMASKSFKLGWIRARKES
uniref:Uncharacterized protein n=1 Tax=viral metagenome TaxID=1070528 RepID=A0A6M3LD36_9ZZZZ